MSCFRPSYGFRSNTKLHQELHSTILMVYDVITILLLLATSVVNRISCGMVISDKLTDGAFQFMHVFDSLRVENLIYLPFLVSILRLIVCIPVNRLFTCGIELLSFNLSCH